MKLIIPRISIIFLSALSTVCSIRGDNSIVGRRLGADAGDGRIDGVGQRRLDTKSSPKQRECDIDEKANQIQFSCKSKFGDKDAGIKIHDRIEYRVLSESGGASIEVKYKNEVKEGKEETETKTQYKVSFDRLVEYVGSNEDGSYSFENNDEELRVVPLDDWEGFSEIVTEDDGIVSYFFLTSSDGMIEFRFTISREEKDDEVSSISANKMKIDFRLTNFPWTRDDANVALFCTVESKQKVKVERGKKKSKAKDVTIPFDQAVDDTGVTPFGEYTWASTAEATSNGTMVEEDVSVSDTNSTEAVESMIEVIATSPEDQEDGERQIIAFSFVGDKASGADEIYWDPEAGIGYASGGTTIAGGVASLSVTVLVGVAASFLLA